MTHHPIKILPDGTRVYSNYTRYKPVPPQERKYRSRKPDAPGAVRYRKDWVLPLELLYEGDRVMPLTRPDSDAYDHMVKPHPCKCDVCARPEAKRWKDRWAKDQIRRVPSPEASWS